MAQAAAETQPRLPVFFLLALAIVHSCNAATHHGRTLSASLSLSRSLSSSLSLYVFTLSPSGRHGHARCVRQ